MSSKNLVKNNLGDVKPYVEAGGKNSQYFLPNLNMSFYNDEFYININRKTKNNITKDYATSNNGKVKLEYGDDIDVFYVDDKGNFKWDIEFSKKPSSNIFIWELKCSKDIEFLYQDVLTQDEINDGCTRDEKIIGSYAVYCNKKNNKYKTGKICHIPRPFVIDANGKTEWCNMSIADGALTITLPETFMGDAVYPVALDPTFGYTSAGASYDIQYTSDPPYGSMYAPHTASTGDTITSFSIYAYMQSVSTYINIAAYSIVSSMLYSRLASPVAIPVTSGTAAWWESSTVNQPLTASSKYGLAFGVFGEPGSAQIAYDTDWGGPGTKHNVAETLPTTWSNNSIRYKRYSLYATYSEGGGTSGNPYYYYMNQ